mmetsp:Transcript_14031/g.45071  ORF Transcript_14031/g.45071 Transcript_14031/m.45071 type:complete len:395 (+) Transcript_14031:525-1709(+)
MRSKRPGRSSAGSIRSGRLVAAMTTTRVRASTPSISCKSCERTRVETWLPPERTGASASISSKKTMAGALARALRKRDATSCSDSPTHFERSSGPLTARKLVRVSAARARAASVFEQPGGPYSSTPRGGRIPSCANRPACSSGHTTASCSACLSRPCPPTSPHDTAGTLISRPRSGPGRTCGSAASKSQRPTTRADSAATAAPAAPASAATPTRGDEASDRLAVATPVRPAPSAAPAAAAPAACCPAPCADAAPLRCREMARAIAWRVRASRSARTRPDVLPASLESCESVRECGTWARSASSSRRLSASSGTAASTSQSNRPGRRSAGSIASAAAVVARTMLPSRKPSICSSRQASSRRAAAAAAAASLAPPMSSSSSMKRTEGVRSRASANA